MLPSVREVMETRCYAFFETNLGWLSMDMTSAPFRYPVRHLCIPTVSARSVVATWEEQGASIHDVHVVGPDGNRVDPSEIETERYFATRFRRAVFRRLTPATAYTLRVVAARILVKSARLTTLPIPGGKRLARIAVVADPHLSPRRTFRRGRLLGVSYELFADVLQTLSREGFDAVVIPGDLADRGDEEAYVYAKKCLSGLTMAKLILAGNQDALATMRNYFSNGPGSSVIDCAGCTLVGLDTSRGRIERETVVWLEALLGQREQAPVLLFTHYALVQDPYRVERNKVAECAESVLKILTVSPQVWGVFSGHKNAVSVTRVGRIVHVICPQIVHYPCAWNVIEVYEGGFMFWTRQINDLRLINLSRCEGDRWLGRDWSKYRLGNMDSLSFVHIP